MNLKRDEEIPKYSVAIQPQLGWWTGRLL